ncbi:serine/threonine protein kinase [Poseidonocella sedimentorum]|uniref:Serine/threonine protein kinase n=1 Tax=Poseidonocella sedimentorum TaxID=871652 RepID=A0A1I6E835_9RHOB|nr:serine/threonine protein kinase [Poseidonocella sedimentorum]SFR13895.1 hypothetical protein SAMN04515673_10842 [Poseidonocella sedimentorum]
MTSAPEHPPAFVPLTVHKRDVFSETISGHLAGASERKLVLRKLSGVPLWARPVAWALARKEIAGLKAAHGIPGTPELIRTDAEGILRSWSDGTPLNLAKPQDPGFYRDAALILARLRQRRITHNDLAKPQNWLMAPDGHAEIIDFQLATRHRRKGLRYRLMAYEDLRHLLKQKRKYARHLLTPTEKRVLARRSLPSRIWMATAKRAYNFITRRLMNWSDGEGAGHRLDRDGPGLRARLLAHPQITRVALSPFSLPARGVGLYGFAETDLSAAELRRMIPESALDHLQPVAALPMDARGAVREDVLQLIAMNRLDELDALLAREQDLHDTVAPIIAGRLNLTDRRLKDL